MPVETAKSHSNNRPTRPAKARRWLPWSAQAIGLVELRFSGYHWVAFLETVFPCTARAAALRSTTEAACIVHDKALGRVGNYHLFRLPPDLEDRLENDIDEIDWTESGKQIDSRESAMAALKQLADAVVKAPSGPFRLVLSGGS